MKKQVFLVIVLCLFVLKVDAQEQASFRKGWGFGFHLHSVQDVGIGVNINTPLLGKKEMVSWRIKGNLFWTQYLKFGDDIGTTNTDFRWTTYGSASVGLVITLAKIGNFMRIYEDLGVVATIVNENISTDALKMGGYASTGFEFFPKQNTSFFLEIGWLGTQNLRNPNAFGENAIIDKFSQGITISVGIRGFLNKKN